MTLSHAMSAASIIACSDVAHQEGDTSWHNYKFLLSVDLRRSVYSCGTSAFYALASFPMFLCQIWK
jgi:hypothetical protein